MKWAHEESSSEASRSLRKAQHGKSVAGVAQLRSLSKASYSFKLEQGLRSSTGPCKAEKRRLSRIKGQQILYFDTQKPFQKLVLEAQFCFSNQILQFELLRSAAEKLPFEGSRLESPEAWK